MSPPDKRDHRHSSAALTPTTDGRPLVTSSGLFVPGYVLAGRYRMIARLGKGGMGEVWRADDLVLGSPVALKLIYSTSAEGRARILNEVRLARQITHPAVCRVYDVGEGDGEIFYSMELVKGQDLATFVRRVGRLPAERVIDIGQQLCDGLAAAHAQGVLHRDLKPANVLIDEDGCVRITDFGIAVARQDASEQALVGTPGYMAPEQLVPGTPLSERTDIYAIGLILYELVVGRPALDRQLVAPKLPPRPSTLVRNVDPRLERTILKALAPDPRNRPASASDMSDMLESITSRSTRWTRMRAGIAAVILAALAAAALGLFYVLTPVVPRAGRALTDRDTIIVADFMKATGDPIFDRTLKVALAVALEQSPFLKVFPDDRVRETLRLMQRSPDERVTRSLARDVARREQLKALVSGSIATLGSHYVLALEAIDAVTGEVVAREQVEVAAREQLLTQLGSATSRLREKLGESLAVIRKFDVPLAQATTSSLDALHSYSLALDQGRIVPRVEAIPHLTRAIELDPNFAMAQALLSGIYANTGHSAEAPVYSRKAFELRNRVSERERFFISWRYYVDAEQAWDKALDLGLSWTATYPREAFAFNSLGLASSAFGHHDQAVPAFREAIRLDPGFVPPHGNLAGSLIALNRFDEASAHLQEAAARGVDFSTIRRMAYLLAFVGEDAAAMTRELDMVRRTPQAMWAWNWEARTSVFRGRFAAAHELFRRAIEAAIRGGSRELAAQWTLEDAEAHAIAGQCTPARAEAASGLALSRDNFTLERAGRTLALCDARAEASLVSAELSSRFPTATLTTGLHLPVIAAATAVRSGEFARAIALLDPAKTYDHAPAAEFWPAYLRAEAHLGLNDAAAAATQFQSILDRRGKAPASPLYSLAQLGLARAAALAGNKEKAREAYERFLTQWSGADPGLRFVEGARRDYARLQ